MGTLIFTSIESNSIEAVFGIRYQVLASGFFSIFKFQYTEIYKIYADFR